MVEGGNSEETREHFPEYLQQKFKAEYQTSKNKVVLPALNSNNIAFDIFSFFRQPEAQIILRSLSKKGLEKSFSLNKYCKSPGSLIELKVFDLKFGF